MPDVNTELRTKAKKEFGKDFLKLMNNAVFVKTMEKVRKHKDLKLVTNKARRNYLVSEPNYHATIFLKKTLLSIEMKKNSNIYG